MYSYSSRDFSLFSDPRDFVAPSKSENSAQISTSMPPPKLRKVIRWMEEHGITRLVAKVDERRRDLQFLHDFPLLKGLIVDGYGLRSLDGLSHHAKSLEDLWIEQTRRNLDLEPLAALKGLRGLVLSGASTGIEVVSSFSKLKSLRLEYLKIPSLHPLSRLSRLQELEVEQGAIVDLGAIGSVTTLKKLRLHNTRVGESVDFVSSLVNLEDLRLNWLNTLRHVPSLRKLSRIKQVHLHCSGRLVKDPRPLFEGKSLEKLSWWGAEALNAAHLRKLRTLPRLRYCSIGCDNGARKAAFRTQLEALGFLK